MKPPSNYHRNTIQQVYQILLSHNNFITKLDVIWRDETHFVVHGMHAPNAGKQMRNQYRFWGKAILNHMMNSENVAKWESLVNVDFQNNTIYQAKSFEAVTLPMMLTKTSSHNATYLVLWWVYFLHFYTATGITQSGKRICFPTALHLLSASKLLCTSLHSGSKAEYS